MTIQISALRWVPPFAQGYVKDIRVRWALEEAGLPYEAILLDPQMQRAESYRKWQPFGQVPAYRDDETEMFESAAIILHIATMSDALAPQDAAGRARMTTWVLAAMSSIEPHAQNLIHLGDDGPDLRARLEAMLEGRLAALSASLGDRDYLEDRFTAGDLVMSSVLRELVDGGTLAKFPSLDAYRRRCEARPAFGRALEAQMRVFRDNAPAA